LANGVRGRGACCVSYAAETEDNFTGGGRGFITPKAQPAYCSHTLPRNSLASFSISRTLLVRNQKTRQDQNLIKRPETRLPRFQPDHSMEPVNKALWSLAEPIGAEG
jgi:hypothetical protein